MTTDRLADLADELRARLVDDPPSASTDPRWRADAGGLPERPTNLADAIRADRERLAQRSGAAECAAEVVGWTSPTAGTSTVTPPHAERLSPYVRAKLQEAERLLAEAAAELKRLRESQL